MEYKSPAYILYVVFDTFEVSPPRVRGNPTSYGFEIHVSDTLFLVNGLAQGYESQTVFVIRAHMIFSTLYCSIFPPRNIADQSIRPLERPMLPSIETLSLVARRI